MRVCPPDGDHAGRDRQLQRTTLDLLHLRLAERGIRPAEIQGARHEAGDALAAADRVVLDVDPRLRLDARSGTRCPPRGPLCAPSSGIPEARGQSAGSASRQRRTPAESGQSSPSSASRACSSDRNQSEHDPIVRVGPDWTLITPIPGPYSTLFSTSAKQLHDWASRRRPFGTAAKPPGQPRPCQRSTGEQPHQAPPSYVRIPAIGFGADAPSLIRVALI